VSEDPQAPQASQGSRPAPGAPKDYRVWVATLVPAAVGLLLFWVLFAKMSGGIVLDGTGDWGEIGKVGAIALIAFGAALVLRLVMAPLVREPLPVQSSDPNDPMRNRIAHAVLVVGGTSIAILTLSLVIAFSVLAANQAAVGDKIDTLLMGLFGSVLPILATWVGTVIAFYFTNESYREAARVAQQGQVEPVKPTVAERMIFYESIGKVEVDTRSDANTYGMEAIWNLMKEPVTRVLMFEKGKRSPIFIIRKSRIPAAWVDSDKKKWIGGELKVEDYRKWGDGSNGSDSIRFEFVPVSATLEHAQQVMRENNVADIFVTARGQKTEAVLGWLTDDLLKGA
jgi:hypothetical protein